MQPEKLFCNLGLNFHSLGAKRNESNGDLACYNTYLEVGVACDGGEGTAHLGSGQDHPGRGNDDHLGVLHPRPHPSCPADHSAVDAAGDSTAGRAMPRHGDHCIDHSDHQGVPYAEVGSLETACILHTNIQPQPC